MLLCESVCIHVFYSLISLCLLIALPVSHHHLSVLLKADITAAVVQLYYSTLAYCIVDSYTAFQAHHFTFNILLIMCPLVC